ncbi:MAG: NRDE family protein [Bacteroidetes bacterium]|nr:NRDE family protein [Bacteroidota bacterium]
MNTGFILTSSRDENPERKTKLPAIQISGGDELIFPMDEISLGTWIVNSRSGRSACLLNGAFVKHRSKKEYAKSRGRIPLEIFNFQNNWDFILHSDFRGVAPFTLVLIDQKIPVQIIVLIWDGQRKHAQILDPQLPQLWSSSTLYSTSLHAQRKCNFMEWIRHQHHPNSLEMVRYHQEVFTVNPENVKFKKNGIRTVSISQIMRTERENIFNYFGSEFKTGNSYSLKGPVLEFNNITEYHSRLV